MPDIADVWKKLLEEAGFSSAEEVYLNRHVIYARISMALAGTREELELVRTFFRVYEIVDEERSMVKGENLEKFALDYAIERAKKTGKQHLVTIVFYKHTYELLEVPIFRVERDGEAVFLPEPLLRAYIRYVVKARRPAPTAPAAPTVPVPLAPGVAAFAERIDKRLEKIGELLEIFLDKLMGAPAPAAPTVPTGDTTEWSTSEVLECALENYQRFGNFVELFADFIIRREPKELARELKAYIDLINKVSESVAVGVRVSEAMTFEEFYMSLKAIARKFRDHVRSREPAKYRRNRRETLIRYLCNAIGYPYSNYLTDRKILEKYKRS